MLITSRTVSFLHCEEFQNGHLLSNQTLHLWAINVFCIHFSQHLPYAYTFNYVVSTSASQDFKIAFCIWYFYGNQIAGKVNCCHWRVWMLPWRDVFMMTRLQKRLPRLLWLFTLCGNTSTFSGIYCKITAIDISNLIMKLIQICWMCKRYTNTCLWRSAKVRYNVRTRFRGVSCHVTVPIVLAIIIDQSSFCDRVDASWALLMIHWISFMAAAHVWSPKWGLVAPWCHWSFWWLVLMFFAHVRNNNGHRIRVLDMLRFRVPLVHLSHLVVCDGLIFTLVIDFNMQMGIECCF